MELNTFTDLPLDDQNEALRSWDDHLQDIKGDIRSRDDPSCEKCVLFTDGERTYHQNAYICECAFEHMKESWVRRYNEELRREARRKEVEMTPKCKYCVNKPDVHMNKEIVCWDCYMYWRAK